MKRKKLNSAEAKIMRGLEDAIAFAKGDTSRGIVHLPKKIDSSSGDSKKPIPKAPLPSRRAPRS
ncbi:MAG: hypothetical protein HQL45_15485 [Alphaproteobacteria bacterium]|nr:hypothetical protein [Alphaproteobacteria bacterium]